MTPTLRWPLHLIGLAGLLLIVSATPAQERVSSVTVPVQEQDIVEIVQEVRALPGGQPAGDLALLAKKLDEDFKAAASQGFPEGKNYVDIAFLGADKPSLIRMQVVVDGKSLTEHWRNYLEKWFRYLDRNGDGVLSTTEWEQAPTRLAMKQMGLRSFLPNSEETLGAKGRQAVLTLLKPADPDKMTLKEFQQIYFDLLPPSGVSMQTSQSNSGQAGDVLFKALDVNKDGKLSKKALTQAAKLLRKFDLNDDEWITVAELLGNENYDLGSNVIFYSSDGLDDPGQDRTGQFHAVNDRLADALLQTYDRAKAKKLSPAQLGLDSRTFSRLDADKNGFLNARELARWHERDADLEMTLFVSTAPPAAPTKPATPPSLIPQATPDSVKMMTYLNSVDQQPAGLKVAVEVRKTKNTLASTLSKVGDIPRVQFDDAQLSFGDVGQPADVSGGRIGRRVMTRSYGNQIFKNSPYVLQQQFQQADLNKRGFVEKVNLEGPEFAELRETFAFLDRDGDGKLTEKEVQDFVNLQFPTNLQFTLTISNQGRELFELIDANSDGRLSARELLNAWDRLASRDKGKAGFISSSDIPCRYSVSVARAIRPDAWSDSPYVTSVSYYGGRMPSGRLPESAKGVPAWFLKMDTNGDGEVSRSEFLGTREDFDRIDSNGDGLISPEEAIRYEATIRKK